MATLTAEARRGALHEIEPTTPNMPPDMQSSEEEALIKGSQGLARRWAGYRARGLLSPHVQKDTQHASIRPNRSFTVKVRYQFRGRGTSLPYPLDNEE